MGKSKGGWTTKILALTDAPGNLVRFVLLPGNRFDTAGAAALSIDLDLYKSRHLIENFFCKLKEFKRIALRADQTDTCFAAMIYAAAARINSRWISTGPRVQTQSTYWLYMIHLIDLHKEVWR